MRDVSLADSRIALERETKCQNRAGTSREWDFDGNVGLGVVGLHLPRAVLVSELLNDLADLRLVGDQCGARGERLGKLGQTSTDFEVKHRKSARNRGIDHS